MAFQSMLAITDWKTENSVINLSNHKLLNYFYSYSKRQKISTSEFKMINYFNKEADLDASVVETFFNDVIELLQLIQYDPFELIFNNVMQLFNYPDKCIITTRSVLSKIMNTPFEINQEKRKWEITAELDDKGNISLYYDKDISKETNSESFTKHYELLKNYLFNRRPSRFYRKVRSINEVFGELYTIDVGDHRVAFTSFIPGVISDRVITSLDELRSADHVYYDLIEAGEFTPELMNYNPLWWSKATLINAKQCIIGVYNKDTNNLQEIIKFNVDKFKEERPFENIWSPNVAWSFLNDFLQFVKDEFERIITVENRWFTVLKFQSFYDDKPYIVCEVINCTGDKNRRSVRTIPRRNN